MPNMPNNFDGEKFKNKYSLQDKDFWANNGTLFCPTLPNLTDADLLDCVVDLIALQTYENEHTSNKAQLKAEYLATLATLSDIENVTSPTNAQVIAALRFMAKTLALVIKLIARQYQ